jgi:hypothetical protein
MSHTILLILIYHQPSALITVLSGFQHWKSTTVKENEKVHFIQNFSNIKKKIQKFQNKSPN